MITNVKTGKANSDDGLSECYVFFTPRLDVDGANCEDDFIGKAAKAFGMRNNAPLREHGSVVVVPSLSSFPASICGQFATANYNIRDGTILKVVAKKREGWDGVMRQAIQFIRAREGAAHRQLRFDPIPNNELALEWLGISGRFDLLTPQEAEAFGVRINQMTHRSIELHDENLLQCTVLEEETTAPVTMKKIGNSDKLMPVVKRKRRIEDV